jgi:preprotein translocase subunit SecD
MTIRLSPALLVAASLACSGSDEKFNARPDWNRVPVLLELRLAEGGQAPDLIQAPVYGQGKKVYLHPDPVITNRDIVRVEAIKTRIGQGLILQVWFNRAGAARLREVTGKHIGDSLAVVIDSAVVSLPLIRQAIGGNSRLPNDIGVPLQPKEAQRLAAAVAQTWPPAQRRAAGRR